MEKKTSTDKLAPLIWVAFLASVFTYILVLFSLHGGLNQLEVLDYDRIIQFHDPMALGLYVFSALSLGAYYVIPNFIISSTPHKKRFTVFIVRLVLLEAICLYGFALGMVQSDFQPSIPFFVFSFVALFTMSPMTKMKQIERTTMT